MGTIVMLPQKRNPTETKSFLFRTIAILGFILMTIVMVRGFLKDRDSFVLSITESSPLIAIWNILKNLVDLTCWILFAYLIFKPLKLPKCALISFAYSFTIIVDSPGYFMGPLMFMLGMTVLYTNNFFNRSPFKKIILCFSILLLTTLTHMRFGIDTLIYALIQTGGYILVIALIFILIFQKQEEIILVANQHVLNLLKYEKLTDRDRLFVKRILDGEKYEVIARDNGIAEQTMRNRMSKVYKILNVADQIDLLSRYGGYTVITNEQEEVAWSEEYNRAREKLFWGVREEETKS